MRRLASLIVVLIVAVLAATYLLWIGPGGAKASQTIIVEEGANLTRLCPGLAKKELIPGNCQTYRAMARLFGSGDPIQAGAKLLGQEELVPNLLRLHANLTDATMQTLLRRVSLPAR